MVTERRVSSLFRGWTKSRVLVLLGVVAVVAYLGYAELCDRGCGPSPTLIDMGKLRTIVGKLLSMDQLPMRDGALDPYALVREGGLTRGEYGLFRSERTLLGPTDEEIERGDYSNFAWERCRQQGGLRGATFALLWEKTPDHNGLVVAALSDGSVRVLHIDELKWLGRRHAQSSAGDLAPTEAQRRRFDGQWTGAYAGERIMVALDDGLGNCSVGQQGEERTADIEVAIVYDDGDLVDLAVDPPGWGGMLWTARVEGADVIRVETVLRGKEGWPAAPFVLRRIAR